MGRSASTRLAYRCWSALIRNLAPRWECGPSGDRHFILGYVVSGFHGDSHSMESVSLHQLHHARREVVGRQELRISLSEQSEQPLVIDQVLVVETLDRLVSGARVWRICKNRYLAGIVLAQCSCQHLETVPR